MRAPDVNDALAMVGLGILGYGVYLVSLPAALVVVGTLVMLAGVLGAMRG